MILRFTINGPAVPCARARVAKGHAYTPTKTAKYEKHVAVCAFAAMRSAGAWRVDWGAYRVELDVYRDEAKGDADNILKAILDGFQKGGLFDNDAAVADAHVRLFEVLEKPRVEVVIEMMGYRTADELRKWRRRVRDLAKRKAAGS